MQLEMVKVTHYYNCMQWFKRYLKNKNKNIINTNKNVNINIGIL